MSENLKPKGGLYPFVFPSFEFDKNANSELDGIQIF
jgi:hypothetical protein